MRYRFNRRCFLKQGASTLLGASMLPHVVASAEAGLIGAGEEWRFYGGDPGGMRYSRLDQINRSNVGNLQVAWTYHTGDKRDRPRTTMSQDWVPVLPLAL